MFDIDGFSILGCVSFLLLEFGGSTGYQEGKTFSPMVKLVALALQPSAGYGLLVHEVS
jgi:hypothetical protein